MPNMPEPRLGDSGDYTWHPEYTRRTTSGNPYDTTTLGDKLAAAQDEIVQLDARVKHLESIVHRYINRTEGDL